MNTKQLEKLKKRVESWVWKPSQQPVIDYLDPKDLETDVFPNRSPLKFNKIQRIEELAKSMKENEITPITVRLLDGRFQVVVGHRRVAAMIVLKQPVLAMIFPASYMSDERAARVRADENSQRRNPSTHENYMRIFKDAKRFSRERAAQLSCVSVQLVDRINRYFTSKFVSLVGSRLLTLSTAIELACSKDAYKITQPQLNRFKSILYDVRMRESRVDARRQALNLILHSRKTPAVIVKEVLNPSTIIQHGDRLVFTYPVHQSKITSLDKVRFKKACQRFSHRLDKLREVANA